MTSLYGKIAEHIQHLRNYGCYIWVVIQVSIPPNNKFYTIRELYPSFDEEPIDLFSSHDPFVIEEYLEHTVIMESAIHE